MIQTLISRVLNTTPWSFTDYKPHSIPLYFNALIQLKKHAFQVFSLCWLFLYDLYDKARTTRHRPKNIDRTYLKNRRQKVVDKWNLHSDRWENVLSSRECKKNLHVFFYTYTYAILKSITHKYITIFVAYDK